MDATNFFTRRILGLDYGVWITMLLVCLFSLALYSYKQAALSASTAPGCFIDTMRVNGKTVEFGATCYLNRTALFEFPSQAAVTVKWDFQDGSKPEWGRIVSHRFLEEGTHTVKVIVNGTCEYKETVEAVYDPFLSGDEAKPVIEIYADPMRPTTGKAVKLYCVSDLPFINAYEWKVINTNEVKTDTVPGFTFYSEGNYSIRLKVNNDESSAVTMVIKVAADVPLIPQTAGNSGSGMGAPSDLGLLGKLVPPDGNGSNTRKDPPQNNGAANNAGPLLSDTPKIALSKATKKDPTAFKDLLQAVVDENEKEPEDLYEYLDYKGSTMVKVDENGSLIQLKEFCKDMRKKKKNKRKIESVGFDLDDKNSIRTIKVKMARNGGFLNRLNPFN